MPLSVRLWPVDGSGLLCGEMTGMGKDISLGGLSCRVSRPLPVESALMLEPLVSGERVGVLYAVVRRCVSVNGGWYELGLEFEPVPEGMTLGASGVEGRSAVGGA